MTRAPKPSAGRSPWLNPARWSQSARFTILSLPKRRELRGDDLLVRHVAVEHALAAQKRRHAGNEFARQRGIVIGQVAADQLGDQAGLGRRKQFSSDFAGARYIGFQRGLRLDDGAHRRGNLFGGTCDQLVRRRDGRRGIMKALLWSVAAAGVDDDGGITPRPPRP